MLLASKTRNAPHCLAARSNSWDSQASVSALYDTAVWYLVRVCGRVAVWPCGCVFVCGMSDAIGSKNTCKTFSTEFFDWRILSKNSTGSATRNSQSKKVQLKKLSFDCVRKLDFLGFSRKKPFSTDKSDCIRNGLKCDCLVYFVPQPVTT